MPYVIRFESPYQVGFALALAAFAGWMLWRAIKRKHHRPPQQARGQHTGIMIDTGHGFIEISIFETNVEPRFRLYFYDQEMQPVAPPDTQTIILKTVRAGHNTRFFVLSKRGEFLESIRVVPEPRDFQVIVKQERSNGIFSYEIHYARENGI